jgi:hypothetical protein
MYLSSKCKRFHNSLTLSLYIYINHLIFKIDRPKIILIYSIIFFFSNPFIIIKIILAHFKFKEHTTLIKKLSKILSLVALQIFFLYINEVL